MGNRFIAFAVCAACCALIAVGCSHDSTTPATTAPGSSSSAAAPSSAPPDSASVASKVIADLSALPPAQRGRYIGTHQQEIMMATQDPKLRQKVVDLINQH